MFRTEARKSGYKIKQGRSGREKHRYTLGYKHSRTHTSTLPPLSYPSGSLPFPTTAAPSVFEHKTPTTGQPDQH